MGPGGPPFGGPGGPGPGGPGGPYPPQGWGGNFHQPGVWGQPQQPEPGKHAPDAAWNSYYGQYYGGNAPPHSQSGPGQLRPAPHTHAHNTQTQTQTPGHRQIDTHRLRGLRIQTTTDL